MFFSYKKYNYNIYNLWTFQNVIHSASEYLTAYIGNHAVTQAFNRRRPTAAAWVPSQVRSRGVCEQNGTGAGLLRARRFLLPILITPTAPRSLIILPSTLCTLVTASVVK
jgi:hypothetical protein